MEDYYIEIDSDCVHQDVDEYDLFGERTEDEEYIETDIKFE